MKITNIDSFIEEFRNGRDIWSRTTVELAVREIERLRKRIAELEALNECITDLQIEIDDLKRSRDHWKQTAQHQFRYGG